MATLTGRTPGTPDLTYRGLLRVENPLSGTLQVAQDGLGTAAPIQISTTEIDLTDAIVTGLVAGRLVYVDAALGDDAAGDVGELARPFQTLAAAKAAASSGDLIVVRPGTYNEKNLLKNGVNWHFEAGAIVDYTGAATGGIFDDTSTGANGAVVCRITGRGVFKHRHTGTGVIAVDSRHCAVIAKNSGSSVTIEAQSIYAAYPSGGDSIRCIYVTAGILKVTCYDSLICESPDFLAITSWWEGGDYTLRSPYVAGTGSAIYNVAVAALDANAWYTVDLVEELGGAGVGIAAVILQGVEGAAPNARVWVDAKEIRGRVSQNTGKLYIRTDKVWVNRTDTNAFNVVDDAEFWLNAQKYTVKDVGGGTIAPVGGHAEVFLQQIENLASSGSAALLTLSGNVVCRAERVTLAADAIVGIVLGAGATFSGLVDASAATGGNPVSLSASGGTLREASLLANGSRDAVTASSALTVKFQSVSINTTLSANVTASGDVDIAKTLRLPTVGGLSNVAAIQFGSNDNGFNGGPTIFDGGVQVVANGVAHTVWARLAGRYITYFPATMEVQINGNQVMYLDASGKVGINAGSFYIPLSALDVVGDYTGTKVTTGGGAQLRPTFLLVPEWGTSSDATRKGRLVASVYDSGGLREAWRAESNGTVALIGVGTAVVATSKATIKADADLITLTLRRNGSGQASNLLEIQNEDGSSTLMTIDKDGYFGTDALGFQLVGNAAVGVLPKVTVVIPWPCKIEWAQADADTGPTGDDLILDILKNGTSIWTGSPADRLTISDGDTDGEQTAFVTTTFVRGDKLKLEVIQVGATAPGSDIVVTMAFKCKNVSP